MSLYRVFTVAAFALLSLAPARAATHWECMGPAVACGPAHGGGAAYGSRYASQGHVYAERAARRLAAHGTQSRRRIAHAAPHRQRVRVASTQPRVGPAAARKANRIVDDAASSISTARLGRAEGIVVRTQAGLASYYGTESGTQTASGARFNPGAMTAAHRTLPFGTRVRVTNKSNGRSVVVTINDRGPFVGGRVIDLSTGAAGVIGMRGAGIAPVSLEILGRG